MSEARAKIADLFGYVRLDAFGNVIERCSDPPSKWRPEIRALFERRCPTCGRPGMLDCGPSDNK